MSAYINVDTLEYPRFEGDIRLIHPEISNEFVCPPCFMRVEETERPVHDSATQYVIEDNPKKINNKYVQQWRIENYTPDELYMLQTKPTDVNRIYAYDFTMKKWFVVRSYVAGEETTTETQEELTT